MYIFRRYFIYWLRPYYGQANSDRSKKIMSDRRSNNESDVERDIRDAIDDIQDAIRDIRRCRLGSAVRNLRAALRSLFDALGDIDDSDDSDCSRNR